MKNICVEVILVPLDEWITQNDLIVNPFIQGTTLVFREMQDGSTLCVGSLHEESNLMHSFYANSEYINSKDQS